MSLRKPKLIVYLITIAVACVTAYTIYDYLSYQQTRTKKSIRLGRSVKKGIEQEIDSMVSRIIEKANDLADSLESHEFSEKQLLRFIRSSSYSMKQILGVTVAFEPYRYKDSVRLFAPYYDKKRQEFIYIEEIYDYTDSTLSTSKWYTNVRDHGASWVEPYFAEGAQAMVSDYGVPFYQKDSLGNKKLQGTVTLTISLQDFTRLLHSISLGKTGYGFVASEKGNFIAHPINEYVSRKNVLDLAREQQDQILEKVAMEMRNKQSGFVEFKDQMSDQVSYLFYSHLPTSGWNLGIVFIKNELLGNPVAEKQKIMHIVFSASLLVLGLIMLIFKLYHGEEDDLWSVSLAGSIILTLNIIIMWYLTLHYAYQTKADEDNVLITNYAALNSFVNQETKKAEQMKTAPPVLIPTGVYIEGLEFADSYNVNVSGTIWQKYHNLIPLDIQREVELPQVSPFAEALYIDQKRKEVFQDYELMTWDFRATLRLDFDYSTYPFDYRQLNIQLSHPDIQKNVMLTPDLVSYKIINRTSKPGVNQSLVLPESSLTSSFFNYNMKRFNTNFGNTSLIEKELFPALHFNIILKREFINAFVSNIIPILIVALMVYFVVYSSAKTETAQRTGISSLGVVESSAAFFFVLILAHIDLRKTVSTPVITYMEYFYFIMYLLLALIVFNIVLFTRKDNFLFFDYKDNLIIKLIYWPLFLGMCFIVTLIKFY